MLKFPTRINGPVAVIGDVHGQVGKLITVLDKLRETPDFDKRWIVFIGDLVDRGPDPKAALDVLSDLMMQHRRTTAIAGNHDFAMAASLGLIPTPEYSNWAERWMDHYDAHTTFDSYQAEQGNIEDLKSRLPDRHQEILSGLPWCVEHPKYLFVHAGIDPNQPFALQMKILKQKDFSMNRPPWLCSKTLVKSEIPKDCPFSVVSGHVRVPQVSITKKRILTDTTGGHSGELSCVLLPENKVISSGQGAAPVQAGGGKSWWKVW